MKRVFAAAVLVFAASAAGPMREIEGVAQTAVPNGAVRWWSAGDSYSSGEGASGATGTCQLSLNAFGPKAATILRRQRAWRIDDFVFSACTGAVSPDQQLSPAARRRLSIRATCSDRLPRRSEQDRPRDDESLEDWARSQDGWPASGRFDVVTVSFGGNDFCFPDIVFGCLGFRNSKQDWLAMLDALDPAGCDVSDNELRTRIDDLIDGGPQGIARLSERGRSQPPLGDLWQLLATEHLTERGVLVVAGYPRLMTPSSEWGEWRGGRCNTISADDADMLGELAEHLDQRMGDAVDLLAGDGIPIRYVSRLDIFDKDGDFRNLCSRGVEWINSVFSWLRDEQVRYNRAFHPNDLGNTATAQAVAGTIAQAFEEYQGSLAPPSTSEPTNTQAPTTQPTIPSGEATYEIGTEFSARCTIAWPTAPQRGIDSIQMRTFCPGIPTQFQFADIAYGDPDLPVTPSNSTMDVHGTIVDIVRSEFGFTVLAVAADEVELVG